MRLKKRPPILYDRFIPSVVRGSSDFCGNFFRTTLGTGLVPVLVPVGTSGGKFFSESAFVVNKNTDGWTLLKKNGHLL